jgi:15-cis-phytoene synthase
VTDIVSELPPLHRLITAYAPKAMQEGMRHVWAFDARLADIVRTTSEPMIGQMRLTWWHEALREGKGAGEPLVEALRQEVLVRAEPHGLLSVIEGWEVLLEPLPLSDSQLIAFAEHRGGGLFRQIGWLAGDCPPWLAQAGMAWALWDLSGHLSDAATAERAIAIAPEFLADVPERGWPRSLAPLRILTGLTRRDAGQGRRAPARLDLRQYGRLLWLGMRRG